VIPGEQHGKQPGQHIAATPRLGRVKRRAKQQFIFQQDQGDADGDRCRDRRDALEITSNDPVQE
jgi:hypothetical protein